MTTLPTREDLSQASGVVPGAYFDQIYEGFMDDALFQLGRQIKIHLQPSISEDKSSNIKNSPAGFNPFFHGSMRPTSGGKNRGITVETRDIPYTAHIRHGPQPKNDRMGVGELSEEQVQTTTVYESLQDIENCISATIDNERYEVDKDPRSIGFRGLKYVICVWKRIAEEEK